MLDLEITFQSPQSVENTFAFIARDFFDHHQQWDPAIIELRKTTPGPIEKGTQGVEVRRFLTKQAVAFEVTSFLPTQEFAFTNTTGPFELDRRYTFQSNGDGTQVRFSFRMAPRVAPVRILWPLLRRVIAGQVRTNIDRLAGLLATPAPVAP